MKTEPMHVTLNNKCEGARGVSFSCVLEHTQLEVQWAYSGHLVHLLLYILPKF